jgi:hypothetical protein
MREKVPHMLSFLFFGGKVFSDLRREGEFWLL